MAICWIKTDWLFASLASSSKNSMLNSAEHDFFLLTNVEMPVIFGILTFMSRKIVF